MKLGTIPIAASLLLFFTSKTFVEASHIIGSYHGPEPAPAAPTVAAANNIGNGGNKTDISIHFPRRLISRAYPPPLEDLLLPPISPRRTAPLSVSEATLICQNRFFGLNPENWIMSGATDFLETYTAATKGDFLRQSHGLLGSMAYRYLGEEGWSCSVENTQGCTVSCKEIVMAIEDIEEARNVYFVLSSVAHFTAVTDLIHSGLSHAQSNVGMMAPKMAFDFFWAKRHTHADDVKLILHLVITGMGQLMELLTPFVPFVQVIENLHKQLESFDTEMARRVEMEHISWLFLRTAVMFDTIYAHEWPGNLKSVLEAQQQIGFYAHITGMRGSRENEYFGRKYDDGETYWWLYKGKERQTEKQPDGSAWKGGYNNIFDRLTRRGWKRREGELSEREGGPAHPPSHHDYTWKGIYQEENDRIKAMREFKDEADKKMWKMKNDAKRIGIKAFVGWLPTVLLEINDWLAAEDEAPRQDINLAWLSLKIQESTRQARTHLRRAHDEMMNPTESGCSGETMLSLVLSTGLYLPSNSHMLKEFTHHDIENKITKNIFHKALNTALKAQKVYITCTADLQSRKKPHHNSGDSTSSCSKDNTGPADLKSCITLTSEQSRARGLGDGPVELVCYMYKWATRGDKTRHYNERPAGSDNWEDDWGVIPKDVITSSVLSHLGQLDDSSILVSLDKRPSAETIADPSAPGVFTIPVCISRHNWNNGLRDFGHFDKLSSHTSKKNLPCSCGFWGDETEQVWRSMGIWDTHRAYYRMDLCANQRKKHMRDPLEIYVNDCHLGCKKGVFKPKLGKDGLCDVVLNVLDALRKRGYEEDLDPEIRDSIYCRINNDKKCKKLNLKLDEPFDTIFDQLSDKPYVKETQVPESTLYAEEAVNIADCLYGMSLKLALTAEHEDIIAKHNKENPEKNEGLAEKAFVHGAAKKV